jgi:hypothetical protein
MARKHFRHLAEYYPPRFYYGGYEKIIAFYLMLQTIQKHRVEGDIVECGVGRGLSFFILGHFIHQLGLDCRLYGFDSFQGFPAPSRFDKSFRQPIKGDKWRETSVAHVCGHFTDAGMSRFLHSKVVLIPGFFNEILPRQTEPKFISLLSIDADLYESYFVCMCEFGPRVTGVILYDEYNDPKWPGATRAVNENLSSLDHVLFHSKLMRRHFSLSKKNVNSPFGQEILKVLQAESSDKNL